MTIVTATSLPNDTRLKDFLKEVRDLGGTHAEGNEALTKLALGVAEKGRDGVITLDKNHDKKDSIDQVYDEYIKGFSKKAASDHTPNGMTANKSKLRAILKAAVKTSCDFPVVAEDVLRTRKEEDANGNKTEAPYQALVKAARLQQAQDDNLSSDQIRELVLKDGPREKTVEGQAKRALKIVDDLITGEGGLPAVVGNEHLIAAHENLEAFVAGFQLNREKDEALAIIAKMGWSVVEKSE